MYAPEKTPRGRGLQGKGGEEMWVADLLQDLLSERTWRAEHHRGRIHDLERVGENDAAAGSLLANPRVLSTPSRTPSLVIRADLSQ